MKSILVFLKDYKKESVIAPLFKMLEAIFELIVPLVVAQIIDIGIENMDKTYIWQRCGILVLLAVIGLVCAVSAQYFAAKAAVGFATQLRSALFKHIQKLSYTDIDRVGSATLITRMTSDVNQLQSGVNMVLRLFMRSPFVVFGAMIMAFTVDVKAAIVFVIAIPLLCVVVFGIMLLTMPMYKKVQAALDRVLGKTKENLTGARVIRAFNKEQEEMEAFEESNEILTNLQLMVGKVSALMNPITLIIVNVSTLVIIWSGAKQVFDGILTTGEVVALVSYMSQILVELVKLANLIILITKALACGRRVADILEKQPAVREENGVTIETDPKAPVVVFDKASLAYKDSTEEAISDISFTAHRGQTVGIIGGTGSGKTSLVNLIPRFYDTTRGTVLVEGVDVREYPLRQLREKIGIVPQKAVLFQGTIAENLRWGNENATDEELWDALEIAQAKEVVLGKENGLLHMVEQGGRNFSGGQKQRLTIARALVRKPDILILDDSASALDFATDAALRSALKTVGQDCVTFIVSQRTSSLAHADLILVLDDGEVVGMGKHHDLLESCEVYREIYDSQFKQEKGGKGNA